MEDERDEAQEAEDTPAQEKPKLHEISEEDLHKILAEHAKWVESEGREGERANLARTNLRGKNFQGANLQGADLQGANLGGAKLQGANLQEANLEEANLQEAFLINANLQEAELNQANLQEAELNQANLQGAELEGANLQGAILWGANLQGANLWGANLQEAKLSMANLQEAKLQEAKFQEAYLVRANLREAILQDADLAGAKGLLSEQLAGANVSGAKLPEDIKEFKMLETTEEASRNARKIFLAMLLGCAYSILTIFSTKDAGLLTNSASSPLPIIRTAIPIAGFFVVAPPILFAIFLYFHIYLQRLWEGLADLPAVFPDGRPLDKRAYPWLLNGLVRSHFALLRKERPPLSYPQAFVSILLAWWAVPLTIALFWLRYLPKHHWVGTGFHLSFLVLAIVFAVWFQRLTKITLRGQQLEPIRFREHWKRVEPYKEVVKRAYKLAAIGVTVLLLFLGVSYGAIEGVPPEWEANPSGALAPLKKIIPKVLPYVRARAFANLVEEELSTKPPNWFRDGELPRLVKGAQLKDADLRYAKAVGAFLVNADLRGANLQEADLKEAKLQGARLWDAKLQKADLWMANLQGAILWKANLQEANLQGATLWKATLHGANLLGADFRSGPSPLSKTTGLTPSQLKAAKNWELAFYDDEFLKELGLPPDHNETLPGKLAELKEKEKAAAGKK
ncbi:MAG: pentapeptide repeat-containing protein [Nitrospinae bacterium]|nr:pentapeptide repeat-containing protein [Nitrospinota bacterium]